METGLSPSSPTRAARSMLTRIRAVLKTPDDAPRPVVVLAGHEGFGKTRLLLAGLARTLEAPVTWGYPHQDPWTFDPSPRLPGEASEGWSGEAFPARLLRTSPDAAESVLRPLTAAERHAGVERIDGRADSLESLLSRAAGESGRRVQRAAARLHRQLQRSAQPLTFAALWRRLIRAAVLILLRMQRRRHADTPESVTHSHSTDQHRTRGPNPARTTSSFLVPREPVPA